MIVRLRSTESHGGKSKMTNHEVLWFVSQIEQFHKKNERRPEHRFTLKCLYMNVHPNQEYFGVQESSFQSVLRELTAYGYVKRINRFVSPPDSWVLVTSAGYERLKKWDEYCPYHPIADDTRPRNIRTFKCNLDRGRLHFACVCGLLF